MHHPGLRHSPSFVVDVKRKLFSWNMLYYIHYVYVCENHDVSEKFFWKKCIFYLICDFGFSSPLIFRYISRTLFQNRLLCNILFPKTRPIFFHLFLKCCHLFACRETNSCQRSNIMSIFLYNPVICYCHLPPGGSFSECYLLFEFLWSQFVVMVRFSHHLSK